MTDQRAIFRLKDANCFDRREKQRIFRAWVRFIRSGFRRDMFSSELCDFLIMHCDMYPYSVSASEFWEKYFSHLTGDLRHFLAHFDQTKSDDQSWTRLGSAADLGALMRDELERLLPQIDLVLHWYEMEMAQNQRGNETVSGGVRITERLYDRLAAIHTQAVSVILWQPALFSLWLAAGQVAPAYDATRPTSLIQKEERSPERPGALRRRRSQPKVRHRYGYQAD